MVFRIVQFLSIVSIINTMAISRIENASAGNCIAQERHESALDRGRPRVERGPRDRPQMTMWNDTHARSYFCNFTVE